MTDCKDRVDPATQWKCHQMTHSFHVLLFVLSDPSGPFHHALPQTCQGNNMPQRPGRLISALCADATRDQSCQHPRRSSEDSGATIPQVKGPSGVHAVHMSHEGWPAVPRNDGNPLTLLASEIPALMTCCDVSFAFLPSRMEEIGTVLRKNIFALAADGNVRVSSAPKSTETRFNRVSKAVPKMASLASHKSYETCFWAVVTVVNQVTSLLFVWEAPVQVVDFRQATASISSTELTPRMWSEAANLTTPSELLHFRKMAESGLENKRAANVGTNIA
eukprot:1952736-Amphidinium_carterae.2